MAFDSELLAGFPVVVEQQVRWGDLDAFGHVNNIIFFQFFESARMKLLTELGFASAGEGVGPILHSTHCRFRRPLTYPDQLGVGVRVTRLDADRFTTEYRIVSATQRAVAAEGEGVLVAYDYRQQAKADVPPEVVARIQSLGQR